MPNMGQKSANIPFYLSGGVVHLKNGVNQLAVDLTGDTLNSHDRLVF